MKFILFCAAWLTAASSFSQTADSLRYCLTPNKVGVGGFDPVSYFSSSKPLTGLPAISASYENVEYRFASVKNRELFLRSPSRYLPQFGGWCSMTLAMGRVTIPTYDNFLIQSDKLFLFERTLSVNGRELWLQDPKGNAILANTTYKKHIASGSGKK